MLNYINAQERWIFFVKYLAGYKDVDYLVVVLVVFDDYKVV